MGGGERERVYIEWRMVEGASQIETKNQLM